VLTAILWITLIALTVLLIAIASPIQASCKAVYTEGKRDTEFRAAAYYMHPLVLRAEYSAEDERFDIFILGFKKKRGGSTGDQDGQGIDTEDIDTRDVDKDGINTNVINTEDTNTDGINKDGINTKDVNTNGIDSNSINTDNINTSGNTEIKEEKVPLMSRIKSKINDIKSRRVYKIISNKPLRKKLLRWLKRSSIRVMRTVSIKKLKLHIRLGIQNPATLGKMYGYFSAAQSALTLQRYRVDLDMEPIFMEKCLSIDSELKIKTTLSTILWQLAMIAVTFPYLRVRKIIRIKS